MGRLVLVGQGACQLPPARCGLALSDRKRHQTTLLVLHPFDLRSQPTGWHTDAARFLFNGGDGFVVGLDRGFQARDLGLGLLALCLNTPRCEMLRLSLKSADSEWTRATIAA